MENDRCVADGSPRLRDVGDEREPTLVDKHYDCPSPSGLFFIPWPGAMAPVLHGAEILSRLAPGALPGEAVALEQAPHRAVGVSLMPHSASVTWMIRGMVQRSVENP